MSRVDRAWPLVVVALIGFLCRAYCGRGPCQPLGWDDRSPDGRYAITVCRYEVRGAMPGQSGDAPGIVRLVDMRTGKILREKEFEMINAMPSVEWAGGWARLTLFAEWSLPY